MKPNSHNPPSKFLFSILLATLIVIPQNSQTADFSIHRNPRSYVLTKIQTHDIVFLGTRHKQPPILEFISELITELHNSGVTHIGLEIASDQQAKIDQHGYAESPSELS